VIFWGIYGIFCGISKCLFFPYKLNTFRKRVENVATTKGIQVGIEYK
jgi:hypothetical protein